VLAKEEAATTPERLRDGTDHSAVSCVTRTIRDFLDYTELRKMIEEKAIRHDVIVTKDGQPSSTHRIRERPSKANCIQRNSKIREIAK
jgi:hypothetical protein